MIVLYIKDLGSLSFSGQKYHPQKTASQYHAGTLIAMVRYNQAQSAFNTTLNASNRLLQSLICYAVEFFTD